MNGTGNDSDVAHCFSCLDLCLALLLGGSQNNRVLQVGKGISCLSRVNWIRLLRTMSSQILNIFMVGLAGIGFAFSSPSADYEARWKNESARRKDYL